MKFFNFHRHGRNWRYRFRQGRGLNILFVYFYVSEIKKIVQNSTWDDVLEDLEKIVYGEIGRDSSVQDLLQTLVKKDLNTQKIFLNHIASFRGKEVSPIYFVTRMEVIVSIFTFILLAAGGTFYAFNTQNNQMNNQDPVITTDTILENNSTPSTNETYSSTNNVDVSTISDLKVMLASTPRTSTATTTTEPPVISCPDIRTSDLNKHGKSRCLLGTCSYETFKIIPPPRTPKCDVVRPIRLEPSDNDSSQLDVIKCKSIRCLYEAIELKQFSMFELPVWNFLQQRLGKIQTLSITHDPITCDDGELPLNSLGVDWPNLEWLRFHDMNQCPDGHQAAASWTLPKLSLILYENVFISNADSKHVSKLFKKNLPNVKTLILRNVSLCNKCDLFQMYNKFCALEQAQLMWDTLNPNSNHVINQTEMFLMNVPNLRGLEMNAELNVNQIEKVAPELKYLERIDFVIVVAPTDDFDSNFSLESISQFQSLRNVTIRLKFKHKEDSDSQQDVKVTGFDKIPATVKNITIFSELPFSQVLDLRKFCEKLIIEENMFSCEIK